MLATSRSVLTVTGLLVLLTGCAGTSDQETETGYASSELRSADPAAEPRWMKHILSFDHRVDHVSTVSANLGETVQLAVRERVSRHTFHRIARGKEKAKVVLFMHGASVPSVPDFDLRYGNYGWMGYLANEGFDVFAMDVQGYGLSARPKMDDPCNAPAAQQQALLVPNPLPARCAASYAKVLTTSSTETDDLSAVVEYLRRERGVDKISLVGWSQGGLRVANYVARNPDKVETLFLYAPLYNPTAPGKPPAVVPAPGTPMTLQTRTELFSLRWGPFVKCEGQLATGILDPLWKTIMSQDPLGSTWGNDGEGVMRVRTFSSFGWNREWAAKITIPTFIIVGEFDANSVGDAQLYTDLGSSKKMLVNTACASHFMLWEKQHSLLHWTSAQWLKHQAIEGVSSGVFKADADSYIEGVGGPFVEQERCEHESPHSRRGDGRGHDPE